MDITKSLPITLKREHQRLDVESCDLSDKTLARDIQIKEQSKELEAVFLTHLVKSMEKTIPKNTSGSNQNMATMMFSSVMGDALSKGRGMGLSEMIYNSLKEKDSHIDTSGLKSNELMNSVYATNIFQQGIDE